MSELQDEESVRVQDATSWLQIKPAFDPRFPPHLESCFVADTESVRLAALKVVNGSGCIASIIVSPILWLSLPDAHHAVLRQFVCGVLPMALGFALALRTSTSIVIKEGLQVLLALAMGVVIANLLQNSRHSPESYLFGGLLLLGILSAVGARLSFRATRILMLGLTLVFETTIWRLPNVTTAAGVGLALMWVFVAFYVLYGNWQTEIETRRTYALTLLERASRDDLARANEELVALAGRDPLTELANRRSYESWLSLHWRRAAADGSCIGLILVDIDFFKRYNDHYGHAGGDDCLRAVARAMRESARETSDYVARLGGEEFAVLLPGLSPDLCADVAERLRQAVYALQLAHEGAGQGKVVTISCGAACLAITPDMSPNDLFETADAALYRAKEAGRNRVWLSASSNDKPPPPRAAGGEVRIVRQAVNTSL